MRLIRNSGRRDDNMMPMHLYFIGVTTKQSAIARILPLWSEALNTDLKLIGVDIPIDADASLYRKAVSGMKNDPKALGSVVTTHKLKVFEHASDLFDEFDALTELTKEISTIAKRGSRLTGMAVSECLSTTLSLKSMLGTSYWLTHQSDVLCFGVGGAARAIALSLLFDFESDRAMRERRLSKPHRLVLVDIDQERLQSITHLLEPLRENLEIEYICQAAAEDNDRLLSDLPSGSLIINATGMGKDRPGSPLTDHACFAAESVIWELNYRGERKFLQQAKSQEAGRALQIHDGWLCFLHGWTQTLQLVLQQSFSPEQFQHLAAIAEPFRVN
jgi:shikimate 5-dehydrogenase